MMNDFFLITKINFLDFLDLRKVTKERKRNIFGLSRLSTYFFMFAFVFIFLYQMVNKLLPSFFNINKGYYVLGFVFLFVNLFIFLYNLFKVKNSLFCYKDYALLASLPIKRNVILTSKLVLIYLLNLGITILFMFPTLLAYINYDSLSIYHFFLIIVIPIVPLGFSILVNIIISLIVYQFKNHNILSYFFVSLLLFGLLLVLFNTTKKISLAMPYFFINIVDNGINYFFYLMNYLSLIEDLSFKNVFFFLLYPLIISFVTIIFLDKKYYSIRNRIVRDNIMGDYNVEKYPQKSLFQSLYTKEFKKITSNSLYIINSLFGCILIILIIVFSFFFGNLMQYFNINNIKCFIIVFVSFLCMISSTTHSSISLEGRAFWVLKMLPVREWMILCSKILVNLTFLLPTIFLSLVYFGISLKMGCTELLILFFMPLMYALLTSVLGLLLNLIFPRFNYHNDLKILTQSTPVFFNLFFGMMLLLFPLAFLSLDYFYVIINMIIVSVINIIIIVILYYYGCKRIKTL